MVVDYHDILDLSILRQKNISNGSKHDSIKVEEAAKVHNKD